MSTVDIIVGPQTTEKMFVTKMPGRTALNQDHGNGFLILTFADDESAIAWFEAALNALRKAADGD